MFPVYVFCESMMLFVLSALVGLGSSLIRPLEKYNVDQTKISVSGFASGASMATQLHVAYSSMFMGVGMVAGSPYWCAQGESITATGTCMTQPQNIDVSKLTEKTLSYASSGLIDPTNNMYNDRVFILSGALDTAVVQGVGMKAQEYYDHYVNAVNIKTVYNLAAEHTFPTLDYGNACYYQGSPYIGYCNYDGAYEMLNHFYGGLTKPSGGTAVPGDFYEFNQAEFFYTTPPAMSSMDSSGYVYVPSRCVSGTTTCKLHVALHGCSQGKYILQNEFAMNSGYNAVGELNNIIIIYPQAIATGQNPMGCWDWWGYNDLLYATKSGSQPEGIWRMVQKVAY
jgi:poly(3-hydroxybutyrate) depolymerase